MVARHPFRLALMSPICAPIARRSGRSGWSARYAIAVKRRRKMRVEIALLDNVGQTAGVAQAWVVPGVIPSGEVAPFSVLVNWPRIQARSMAWVCDWRQYSNRSGYALSRSGCRECAGDLGRKSRHNQRKRHQYRHGNSRGVDHCCHAVRHTGQRQRNHAALPNRAIAKPGATRAFNAAVAPPGGTVVALPFMHKACVSHCPDLC